MCTTPENFAPTDTLKQNKTPKKKKQACIMCVTYSVFLEPALLSEV